MLQSQQDSSGRYIFVGEVLLLLFTCTIWLSIIIVYVSAAINANRERISILQARKSIFFASSSSNKAKETRFCSISVEVSEFKIELARTQILLKVKLHLLSSRFSAGKSRLSYFYQVFVRNRKC